MAIKIPEEARDQLKKSIIQYFDYELDQDIGDLKAMLLLDFCLEEIGPTIYNQAIADAQQFMQEKLVDMDANCHEPEFTYWVKRK